jgi:hypothetical protein
MRGGLVGNNNNGQEEEEKVPSEHNSKNPAAGIGSYLTSYFS